MKLEDKLDGEDAEILRRNTQTIVNQVTALKSMVDDFGDYARLVWLIRERFPAMRIVTDRDTPGANAVASSRDDVRELLRSLARAGGPIIGGP